MTPLPQARADAAPPTASMLPTAPSSRYAAYVLAILFLAYTVNALDRGVINLLLQSIRDEFGATDTQLGMLTGIAFAAFYSIFGIPIAALADRANRRTLLACAILMWSATTASCGFAGSFMMLLMLRIGTAVGEAGGTPPSHSLIADYFAPGRRATALAIYSTGIPIGMMLGNLLGGHGNDLFGWRTTLVLAGLPGLLLAPIILLTIREPRRGCNEGPGREVKANAPPLWDVFLFLWRHRSFRHMSMACAFHAFVVYGAGNFQATFFMRSHGLSSGEAGNIGALLTGIGAIGTLCGGLLADRLNARRNDARWYLWVPAIGMLCCVPLQLVGYLHPSMMLVVPALLVAQVLGNSYYGPGFAMTQALASIRMRAVAASVLLFIQSLIGLGIGPILVGKISDLLADVAGKNSLRYGIVVVVFFNLWSAVHYALATRTLRADLETTRRYDAAPSGNPTE
jgi:MFS family permease